MSIYPVSDGHGIHTVTMELSWREAAYVLACLGASNNQLFDERSTADLIGERGPYELFLELRNVLGIQGPYDYDEDSPAPPDPNRIERLYRKYSAVLDAWCGRRNYSAARRVAEEVGL